MPTAAHSHVSRLCRVKPDWLRSALGTLTRMTGASFSGTFILATSLGSNIYVINNVSTTTEHFEAKTAGEPYGKEQLYCRALSYVGAVAEE